MAKDAFGEDNEEKSYTLTLRGVIAAAVIALLIIVTLQNFDKVTVQLLFWSLEIPLWGIIAGSAVLGAMLDGSVRGLYRYLRGKPKNEE